MVEHRPLRDFIAYAILIFGVFIVAFPVYLALIASTHDMRLVRDLFTRAVIMHEGRIVIDAPTEEIIHDEVLLEEYGLELP